MDRLKGAGGGSSVERLKEAATLADEKDRQQGASDENCFLRLHVPHYVGPPSNHHARIPTTASGLGNDHGSVHGLRSDGGALGSPMTPQHPWEAKKLISLAVPQELVTKDVLDGGRATCGPLQLAKASLKQKQQQLKLLRLEAQSPELWPDAVKKLHRILQPFGEESLLRDILIFRLRMSESNC
eukprot:g8657.t1